MAFPGENRTVEVSGFLPSALEELESQGTYVLFDDTGKPFGFVQEGSFTDTVRYGNLTLKSSIEGGDVIGGSSLERAAMEMAKLRMEEGMNLDNELLRQKDFLDYAYYSQRYDGLDDFLRDGMGLETKQESIDFMKNLDPEAANELLNMYDAIESGNVGPSHYQQILETLNEMNDEDLSKYLDEEELQRVQEFLDGVEKEVAKRALEHVMENIGQEELEMLYDVLKQMDYSVLYEVARDYMRDMARDGTLDNIGEELKDSGVGEEILDKFGSASKEFLSEQLMDFLPKDAGYYLLAVGALALVFTLRRVGG